MLLKNMLLNLKTIPFPNKDCSSKLKKIIKKTMYKIKKKIKYKFILSNNKFLISLTIFFLKKSIGRE